MVYRPSWNAGSRKTPSSRADLAGLTPPAPVPAPLLPCKPLPRSLHLSGVLGRAWGSPWLASPRLALDVCLSQLLSRLILILFPCVSRHLSSPFASTLCCWVDILFTPVPCTRFPREAGIKPLFGRPHLAASSQHTIVGDPFLPLI